MYRSIKGVPVTEINEPDCYTISSYLRTAAARFAEYAESMKLEPANKALQAQFELQCSQAEKFARLFENAVGAEVGTPAE